MSQRKKVVHTSDNTEKLSLKFSLEYMKFLNYLTFMDWPSVLRPKVKQDKTKKLYLI